LTIAIDGVKIKQKGGKAMKRFIAISVFLCFMFCITAAYAAPVGNIATPSVLKKGLFFQDEKAQWALVGSADVDLTWDQNLKNQDNDTEYYYYGGKVGVLLMDRFMPYAILGGAEAKKQQYKINSNKVKWDTDYDFVWGAGGTAMLYETKLDGMGSGILRIGVDGNYRQSHLEVDKVKLDDVELKTSDARVTQSKYELEQWQIALAVSYQMDTIIPYVGVKYSDATGEAVAKIDGTSYKLDFENEDNVGIFVGGDILVNDMFTVNVEGRFIDETALTVGGIMRF
jgi:hypothetical protein